MSRPTVRPRVHWFALAALLVALACALVTQGYLHRAITLPGERVVADDGVPAAARAGGSVLPPEGQRPVPVSPPAHTVALTFDELDTTTARATARELDRAGVSGTFFLRGDTVADDPGLVDQLADAGQQVGLQSLTNLDPATAPLWQQRFELRTAQNLLIGAGGRTTALYRPLYSAGPDQLNARQWQAVRDIRDQGYVTVLSDVRASDVAGVTPAATARALVRQVEARRTGSVIDASAGATTPAVARHLVPLLERRGYTVTNVGAAGHVQGATSDADTAETIQGWVLLHGARLAGLVVSAFGVFMLVAAGLAIARALVSVITARRHARDRRARLDLPVPTEPVTVIVPAYNEEAGIEAAVRSIAASEHPVEVVVVDDGSSDDTADVVRAIDLPNVRLVQQDNAGKPVALNTGIQAARTDIVVMVDGDTVFEPSTVTQLVRHFADPEIGAVSGNAKVANRGGVLGRWQHIEYVIGFNLDRRMFDIGQCMPTVPGAVGGFRRSALQRVGLLSTDTLAEDTDLTMALCRDGWRVTYEEDARAWTEAPATLGALWKQRYRWCYGTMQAMWKHRAAWLERGRSGKLGRRGLTYLLLFQVLLPLLSPAVDVFAVYGLMFLDPVRVGGVWLAFLGVQVAMGVYAFRLDGERLGPLWALPLQQVVYRQLMYLVVVQSVFTACAGHHLPWHRMERYGSLRVPPTTSTTTGA